MGLFDKIFTKQDKQIASVSTQYTGLTVYRPAFTSWNGKLYESELVRSAIDARARAVAKLKISIAGSAQPTFISSFKARPNSMQSFYKFFYRACTILDMDNNCIFVPEMDAYGNTKGFLPVAPDDCEIVEYKGKEYIRYTFSNCRKAAVELSKCFIMNKHQYKDDFFGTSNRCLNSTMSLIDINNQAIKEAIKNSATFRFVAQATNLSKDEDLKKSKKRFVDNNMSEDSSGLLLFPQNMTNIQQVDSSPFVVDPKETAQIRTNVFDYFGVNEKILQNSASADEYSAFYEGCVEPFAIQFSDEISACIYSTREINGGNYIYATSNRLQFMSASDKRAVTEVATNSGTMMLDEIRDIWNLPPLPNGAGQVFPHRGEYYYSPANELPANQEDKENGGNEDAVQ